jgi:hypothetical protein
MIRHWKKTDTDRMLNLFFTGSSAKRIAEKMEWSYTDISRQLGRFFKNEKNRCDNYEPVRRVSRVNAPWTDNENEMVGGMLAAGVHRDTVAKIISRHPKEMQIGSGSGFHSQMRQAAVTADLLEAYQYLYHITTRAEPIITDQEYDDLKETEREFGPVTGYDHLPPRERVVDYAPHIRELAGYLYSKWLTSRMEKK